MSTQLTEKAPPPEKALDPQKAVAAAKARSAAIGVTLAIALMVFSMVWPLQVPLGSMVQGLFQAVAAGMTAVSLVLIYRSIRIINFIQIALGGAAGGLFIEFYTRGKLPFGLAILVGIAAGVLVAAVVGLIASTLFFKHPRLVLTIVTIFIAQIVGQTLLPPIFRALADPNEPPRPPQAIIGPWPKKEFFISGLPFRFVHLFMMVLMVGTLIGLAIFFRKTRFGSAIRATAENAERASLLGINVKLLQVGVWTIAGLLGSIAALGPLPVLSISNQGQSPDELLLPFAAAVVARMTSMPIAFFTAVGLVLLRSALQYSTSLAALLSVVQLLIIMGGLLLQRKKLESTRVDSSTSWKAVREVRATPREMLELPTIRRTRRALMLVGAAIVIAIPFISSTTTTFAFTTMWVIAMVGCSLVILTGWTGQMSLGQYAIVASGAYVGGLLTLKTGVPFLLTLPIAGMVGALVAVLIGLPALRIRGLFLAITTLSISAILPLIMFDPGAPLRKWLPDAGVTRPKFLFLDFERPEPMYFLALVIFILVVLSIGALRKSRTGRVLIAMRDNEAGVQSFGIDVVRTRLLAFALSGFIAGLAGAVLVSLDRGMSVASYNVGQSLLIFSVVLVGGISSPIGAFLGALTLTAGTQFIPGLIGQLQPILSLTILLFIPGGFGQMVFGMRDAVLRVVAMRQHIIVPSLFADYSPEAWEKRLAPLAPASQSGGLAALKHDQRYAQPTKVFGEAPA